MRLFTTYDTATPLAIGVCYYASNPDDGSQPRTDLTVKHRAPTALSASIM